MANETDWFQGASLDKAHQRCFWRRIGFGVFFAIAAALLLFPLLTGCATTEPENRICFMKSIGATEDDWAVVASRCMTPGAFQESQKR